MTNLNIPNPKLLTAIIPVYNAEKYLEQCVRSVASFPVNDKEIIIVNDGSKDSSGDIAERLAKEFAENADCSIIFVNQPNQGVSVARNAGLDRATGEWIWFVDADDYALNENFDIPDSDVIMFSYKTLNESTTVETTERLIEDLSSDKETFLEQHVSYLNQTMWFKRNLLIDNGIRFTTGMKMGEDLELQYKALALCRRPVAIDKPIYLYRILPGSATNNSNSAENIVNDSFVLMKNLIDFFSTYRITPHTWLYTRLERAIKTMLNAAGKTGKIDLKHLQKETRNIMDAFETRGFDFFKSPVLRMAYINVRLYLIINKLYIKLRK